MQRVYRENLQRDLQFNLILGHSPSIDQKSKILNALLHNQKISTTVSGIRSSQTETRAKKDFGEVKGNGSDAFYPLLDWDDTMIDDALYTHAPNLIHPSYSKGAL